MLTINLLYILYITKLKETLIYWKLFIVAFFKLIYYTIRTMNIIKVMKMEQIDPVLAIAVAIIVLEREVMVPQEPIAKVTMNPNKK